MGVNADSWRDRPLATVLLGTAAVLAAGLAIRRWLATPTGPLVVVTPDNRFHRCRLLPPIAGFIVPGWRLVVDASWDWSQIADSLASNDDPLFIYRIDLSPHGQRISIGYGDTYDSGVELAEVGTGAPYLYQTDDLFRGEYLPASYASTDADVPEFLAEAQHDDDLAHADDPTWSPTVLTAREIADTNGEDSGFDAPAWTTSGGWLVRGHFRLGIDGGDPGNSDITPFRVLFEMVDGVLKMTDRGFAKPPPALVDLVSVGPVTIVDGKLRFAGRSVRLPKAMAATGVISVSGPWH